MTKRILLPEDPRWVHFCERYSGYIERFAIEVVGVVPSDQQCELFASVSPSRSRTSVASGHGCFGKGTEIMKATGDIVPVEDIRVGDELMGADGNGARNVLELKRGRENMYRFTYSDGSSHVFNESHILCLVATNSKGKRVAGNKISVTVREWLTWGEDKKRCHAIYRSEVKEFAAENSILPIPPYILGIWLGDGHSDDASLTTPDCEVFDAWSKYGDDNDMLLVRSGECGKATTWRLTKGVGKHGRRNPVSGKLNAIGVLNNKHIPKQYLTASYQDRLELLAGLLDTDGHLDKKNSFDFISKEKRLSDGVVFLSKSVGCHATVKKVRKRCVNTDAWGDYWRVTIGRNIEKIPCRVERKKPDQSREKQRPNLHFGIKSVESIGVGDYYGFVLDGDSKFLGGDFTVLHNTGKTASIAIIVLWHLTCFPQSVTLITANDMDQLAATAWKEIGLTHERMRRFDHGWIADHIEVLADSSARIIGFEDTWFVESKTANDKTANKMAGRHGEWLLVIGDEASTLPDSVCTTLTGALTEQHNRMLLTSQYTRNAGFFHRTQTELSIENGGSWNALRFSSIDSPFVSDESLFELWNQYDDDERRVRILGLAPEDSSKHMMNRRVAEAMYRRGRIIRDDENYGWFVLGDIASGEGLRDKSSCLAARVIGYGDIGPDARRVEIHKIPLLTNKIRSNQYANYAADVGSDFSNVTYVIDSGGLGINVCQDLEDMNKVVHRVNWGNPCFKNINKNRYLNLRAQAMHQAARAAKTGRLSILTTDHRNAMLDQSSRIPKTFTDKGRIRVPPKGSTEWDGMGSPDLWDAVCFAFLEDANYIVSDGSGVGNANHAAASALAKADELFGDV